MSPTLQSTRTGYRESLYSRLGSARLKAESSPILTATASFAAGVWCSAILVAPPLVVVGLFSGAIGMSAVRSYSLGRVVVAWAIIGLALGSATHAMATAGEVAGVEVVTVRGIVGSDQAGRDQVVRSNGQRYRLVGTDERFPLGAQVELVGVARPIEAPADIERRMHYARISADLDVYRSAVVGDPPHFTAAANVIRSYLVARASGLDDARAGLLLGLLIGDDSRLPDDRVEAFRRAGLTHLVAVSGSNLAVILVVVSFVLAKMALPMKLRITIIAVLMVLYVVVTRGEPSIVRAGVMAAAALGATWFGVVRDPRRGMLAAVLALGVVDPFLFASIGFQLSVAAAGGIVWWAAPLRRWIGARLADRAVDAGRVVGRIADLLSISLAAQLAVAPLLVWHFGRLSIAGLPANLLAVPLAEVLTVLGIVLAVVSLVIPSALSVLSMPLGWLLGIGDFFAGVPGAEGGVGRVALIVGAACVVLAAIVFRSRLVRGAVAALVVTVGLLIQPTTVVARRFPICTGVAFFSIGQGDAILLRSDDTSILVDTGPPDSNIGAYLASAGIERVDALVLTHGHVDHVGAVDEVFAAVEVASVILPTSMTWPSAAARSGEATIGESGAEIVWATAGDRRRVGSIDIDIILPDRRSEIIATDDPNRGSLVFVAEFSGLRVFLTGEIGQDEQARVAGQVGDVDIMKIAHHGSADRDDRLADYADPEVAVASVGENSYGHPSESTIDHYRSIGSQVLRTDRDGTVVVCASDFDRVVVHTLEYDSEP